MEPDLQEIKPESKCMLSHCAFKMEYLHNEFIETYRERNNKDVLCFDCFLFLYSFFFHLCGKEKVVWNVQCVLYEWVQYRDSRQKLG